MHDSHVNLPIVNRLLSRIYILSFHSPNLPEKFNSQMKYIVYFILCIHVIIMMLYIYIYISIAHQLPVCLYIYNKYAKNNEKLYN